VGYVNNRETYRIDVDPVLVPLVSNEFGWMRPASPRWSSHTADRARLRLTRIESVRTNLLDVASQLFAADASTLRFIEPVAAGAEREMTPSVRLLQLQTAHRMKVGLDGKSRSTALLADVLWSIGGRSCERVAGPPLSLPIQAELVSAA
jgi:hypothetical protein